MLRAVPYLCALLLGLATALAVGCADRDNLVAPSDATQLKAQLAQIKADVAAGDCTGLGDKLDRLHDDAVNLPATVDRRLRRRINDGIRALQQTAPGDCTTAAQAATETQQTETVPPETTTAETQTTATETVPTDTTTVPPPTTEPVPTDTTAAPPSTEPTPPAENGGTPPEGAVQAP